jgi:hypothetical protein
VSADLLRRAADLIEDFAKDTTPGSWNGFLSTDGPGFGAVYGGPFENGYRMGNVMGWPEEVAEEYGGEPSSADMRWLCLMAPHLAEPLAAWLRAEADAGEMRIAMRVASFGTAKAAVAFAKAILDEATS